MIVHKLVTKQNGKTIGVICLSDDQDHSIPMEQNPSTLLLLDSSIPHPSTSTVVKKQEHGMVPLSDLIENRQLFYSLLTNSSVVNKYVYYKSVPLLLPLLKQVEDSFSFPPLTLKYTSNVHVFCQVFPFFEWLQRKKSHFQIRHIQQETRELIQQHEPILLPILFKYFYQPQEYPYTNTATATTITTIPTLSQLLTILYFILQMQQVSPISIQHPYGQVVFHQMELFLFDYFSIHVPISKQKNSYLIQSKIKQELRKHSLCQTLDPQFSQTIDYMLQMDMFQSK